MTRPLVTIVMTVYFPDGADGIRRINTAVETVTSWQANLVYDGPLHLHVADDGSTLCTERSVRKLLHSKHVWNQSFSFSQQERHGVGASLNAGFDAAFWHSPYVLYAVDDWSLLYPFSIDPWVRLLEEREDVGMVRLGPPHPGTKGTVEAFTEDWQGWGLRLDPYEGFAFSHRPALYHKRFIDAYGWFDEDQSALECERLYLQRINSRLSPKGPDIVLALPHPWMHLDSVELAYLDPTKG